MLKVKGEPSGLKWERWKLSGAKERVAAHASFKATGKYSVNAGLYKRCRDEIVRQFHNKCGYCEAPVVDGVIRNPDVDHYRPARGVTEYPSRQAVRNRRGRPHPGYYWLAYEWTNLLPSCPSCNRPGNVGGIVGKWDFFPIAGVRAFRPVADIDKSEEPVLLNPWRDDPNDHLEFDIDLGVLAGKTSRGIETVKILDLNRDGLTTARQEILQLVRIAIDDYSSSVIRGPHSDEELRRVLGHTSTSKTFSAFRSACVRPYLQAIATYPKRTPK